VSRISLLLVLPFLQGCLALGYPSMTYTPEVSLPEPEVHAFKSTWGKGGIWIAMTGGYWLESSIEELPIHDGHLASQGQSYFAYFVGGFPVSFSEARFWSLLLYRPGYEIIEVPSRWRGRELFESPIDKLAWKPAPDLDSQVKALEKLCPEFGLPKPGDNVRQFVAQEYRRLATSPLATTREQRDALLTKAQKLLSSGE